MIMISIFEQFCSQTKCLTKNSPCCRTIKNNQKSGGEHWACGISRNIHEKKMSDFASIFWAGRFLLSVKEESKS